MSHFRSAFIIVASLSSFAFGCSSGGENTTGSGAGGAGTSAATTGGTSGATTSGATTSASTTSGTTTSSTGGFDAGGQVTTATAKVGPITAASGTERTQCITKHLGNTDGAFVRRFHTQLQTGSHHMIVYKSSATAESLTPTDCQPFAGLLSGDQPIFIAQQTQSELVFPNDDSGTPVGLEIDPNQMIRIELHYINTTSGPLDVAGTIDIDTVPLSTNVVKSDLAFWGTKQITIPPNGAFDTGVHFQAALGGTKTFALTTHQHHLGTEMQVWYAASSTDSAKQQVADSKSWSDPPLVLFSTPLGFPDGSGKGFAYECKWNNTTASTVKFGESANDEMCFLWHYYYPSQGFQLCIDGLCTKS